MDINVILVCYNESALLPHTIKHYKKYLPSCKITIYDNQSTDNSVELAKSLGCVCIDWDTNNHTDEYKLRDLKNNSWKTIQSGWIIMADMDEFLCVTEDELIEEKKNGTTILKTVGLDMIGESETLDLTDIDLQSITKYQSNVYESKKLCFLREHIQEINYQCGAHNCKPVGTVKYSSKVYTNKHMSILGLNFLIHKMIQRYNRSELMRQKQMDTHYTDNITKITEMYTKALKTCKYLNA
jgi:glycosyltransferase involved in cell wall biosynthesis